MTLFRAATRPAAERAAVLALTAAPCACQEQVTKRPNSCGHYRDKRFALANGDGGLAALQGQRLQRPIVDLGDEDPLYTRNISNGPPDRRRVSLRWFAASVLTGVFSVAARRRRAAGGDRPRRIHRRPPGARPRHGVRRRRGRREGRPFPPRAGDQGHAATSSRSPPSRARRTATSCACARSRMCRTNLAAPRATPKVAARVPGLPGRRRSSPSRRRRGSASRRWTRRRRAIPSTAPRSTARWRSRPSISR